MRPTKILMMIFLTLLAVGNLPASDSPPGREFSATVEVTTAQGTRSMPMSLKIRRFTPAEEGLALAKTVQAGGQGTLAILLRGRSDGTLHLGAIEYPLGIVVAKKLDDGNYRYTILSLRRTRAEEQTFGGDSLDFPFSIATFEAGDWSTSDGEFYPAAKIHVDPDDGSVTVEQYRIEPGRIYDIRKLK